jgi:hypothetical protein
MPASSRAPAKKPAPPSIEREAGGTRAASARTSAYSMRNRCRLTWKNDSAETSKDRPRAPSSAARDRGARERRFVPLIRTPRRPRQSRDQGLPAQARRRIGQGHGGDAPGASAFRGSRSPRGQPLAATASAPRGRRRAWRPTAPRRPGRKDAACPGS